MSVWQKAKLQKDDDDNDDVDEKSENVKMYYARKISQMCNQRIKLINNGEWKLLGVTQRKVSAWWTSSKLSLVSLKELLSS